MSDVSYDPTQQPRMTPAVQWLLAANIGVYFLQVALIGPDNVYRALGLTGDLASGWWTPFTYMFVHAGLAHIAFNMLALWWVGGPLERRIGRGRFLLVYFVSGLAGSAGALFQAPFSPTVGSL